MNVMVKVNRNILGGALTHKRERMEQKRGGNERSGGVRWLG